MISNWLSVGTGICCYLLELSVVMWGTKIADWTTLKFIFQTILLTLVQIFKSNDISSHLFKKKEFR